MPKIVNHDQRRDAIAEVVLTLLGTRGADALTMRSVAAAGGWSTGSVAHYFPDKDTLLAYAIGAVRDRVADRIRRLHGCTVRQWLTAMLHELLPINPRQRLEVVAWFAFLHRISSDPAVAGVVRRANRELEAVVAARLAEGVAGGELAVRDCAAAATDLLAFVDGLAVRHLFDPRRLTRARMAGLVDERIAALSVSRAKLHR